MPDMRQKRNAFRVMLTILEFARLYILCRLHKYTERKVFLGIYQKIIRKITSRNEAQRNDGQ